MTQDNFKRPESVLVLVYTATGQVLMLERRNPPGFWQSVTGSLDWDEQDPLQAAIRELREETGLEAEPRATGIDHVFPILPEWRHRYHPDVVENREYVFALELPRPRKIQLNPDEHIKYEWLDVAGAMQRCSSWTNSQAIELLIRAGDSSY
jgi:dATP pyrophosphohydrolase